MMPAALVVGAGWSGLACAMTLQQASCPVTLIDAAPQIGGRARRLDVTLGERTFALDNGQHLLLGAYRETLRLISAAGLDPARLIVRSPFALRYPDGCALVAARAPAPWHLAGALLTARGWTVAERAAIARDVLRWKRFGWHAPRPMSAAELLRGCPARVVRRLWRPLCLAALNVDLDSASAQILLNVLRDSLGAEASASDLLLPRHDLSTLLPAAAQRTLQAGGTTMLLRRTVTSLHAAPTRWEVRSRDDTLTADAVVLALPPDRCAALVASTGRSELAAVCRTLGAIASAPIATVYLRYAESNRLSAPLLALPDDPARQYFGQWVIDRGALDPACAGVLSVVVSGNGPHAELDRAALADAIARQISKELGLPAPLAAIAIVEKRATIVPSPGLERPAATLPLRGLFLAGDAADSPYPSTLEGSVRAGVAAAQALLAALD